jgi:hypothetical protein
VAEADPERRIAFRLPQTAQGDWTVTIQAIDTGTEIFVQGGDKHKLPFDGIVFVAHSSANRLDQSLSSLEALKCYLDSLGRDVMSIPLVIQYNRREREDCLPVDRLESLLNPWGLLSFPSSSSKGEGVRETLKAILSLTISHLIQQPRSDGDIDGSGAGQNCPKDEAEKREKGQESVSEPVFVQEKNRPDLQIVSEDRGGVFFDDLRPPIVLPVRIPRKLLEKHGSVRIILEVEIDESNSLLS